MGLRETLRAHVFQTGGKADSMKENYLSHMEIAQLCRELALLLHAGVALGDGLHLLAEEESSALRTLARSMGQRMDDGVSLSSAMEETSRFPAYVTGMVRVGEQTGRGEEALNALADYYEERQRMEHQLRNALVYPAVLLILMLVVIAILLIRVLPIFDEVYASLGSRLTGVAGGLLRAGQLLEAAMPLLCVLLGLAALLAMLFAVHAGFRQRALRFWRNRWGNRGISKKLNDARFARALSMGLCSGLSADEAVVLSAGLLQDMPGAMAACEDCAQRLEAGDALPKALKESGVLPPAACRMLEMGFRSGSGDRVMSEIAQRLAEDAGEAVERRLAQVEPAMVLGASLLVGAILLSVMLPLMHIMTAIG